MNQDQVTGTATVTPPGYRLILVAYDGSKNAERALSRAVSVARQNSASLKIIVVVNPTLLAYGPYAPSVQPSEYDEVVKAGRDALARAVELAKNTLGDVSGEVRYGQAADEILRFAESQNAGLIVVGRRGISGVERFLLGGVSTAVVNHSRCDVLTVK